ncbi:unnamed protein product [Prorocentrum cordatum]|uniref:Uncharacterized protein n=1 Tax=Prorocentrum cordatum TaxID=2364126 RepID=A0ABN9T3Q6_9DINO|nr:unnamed protein product [Polarella glacialis]
MMDDAPIAVGHPESHISCGALLKSPQTIHAPFSPFKNEAKVEVCLHLTLLTSVVAFVTVVGFAWHRKLDVRRCPLMTTAVPPNDPSSERVLGLAAVKHALHPNFTVSHSVASSWLVRAEQGALAGLGGAASLAPSPARLSSGGGAVAPAAVLGAASFGGAAAAAACGCSCGAARLHVAADELLQDALRRVAAFSLDGLQLAWIAAAAPCNVREIASPFFRFRSPREAEQLQRLGDLSSFFGFGLGREARQAGERDRAWRGRPSSRPSFAEPAAEQSAEPRAGQARPSLGRGRGVRAMEVTVSDLDGIGPHDIISVRHGQTRRQAPASALKDRSLKFPALQDGAEQVLKVDVFAPVAGHRLALLQHKPNLFLLRPSPSRARTAGRCGSGSGCGTPATPPGRSPSSPRPPRRSPAGSRTGTRRRSRGSTSRGTACCSTSRTCCRWWCRQGPRTPTGSCGTSWAPSSSARRRTRPRGGTARTRRSAPPARRRSPRGCRMPVAAARPPTKARSPMPCAWSRIGALGLRRSVLPARASAEREVGPGRRRRGARGAGGPGPAGPARAEKGTPAGPGRRRRGARGAGGPGPAGPAHAEKGTPAGRRRRRQREGLGRRRFGGTCRCEPGTASEGSAAAAAAERAVEGPSRRRGGARGPAESGFGAAGRGGAAGSQGEVARSAGGVHAVWRTRTLDSASSASRSWSRAPAARPWWPPPRSPPGRPRPSRRRTPGRRSGAPAARAGAPAGGAGAPTPGRPLRGCRLESAWPGLVRISVGAGGPVFTGPADELWLSCGRREGVRLVTLTHEADTAQLREVTGQARGVGEEHRAQLREAIEQSRGSGAPGRSPDASAVAEALLAAVDREAEQVEDARASVTKALIAADPKAAQTEGASASVQKAPLAADPKAAQTADASASVQKAPTVADPEAAQTADARASVAEALLAAVGPEARRAEAARASVTKALLAAGPEDAQIEDARASVQKALQEAFGGQ